MAEIWGAKLTSTVAIPSAHQLARPDLHGYVGGSGGSGSGHHQRELHWGSDGLYHQALANELFGAIQVPLRTSRRKFNRNLGQPGCLTGVFFYLGLDGICCPVLLHEMGHGLGFSTVTSGATGSFLGTLPDAFPSVYDHFLLDSNRNLTWAQMTPAERVPTAINNAGTLALGRRFCDGGRARRAKPACECGGHGCGVGRGHLPGGPTDGSGSTLNNTSPSGEVMPIASDACAPLTGLDAPAGKQ